MSEFKEIKTQEEFDTAIKERLARENKKYEGFVSPDKLAELKADYEKEISKKYEGYTSPDDLATMKKEYEGIYEKTIRLHVLANSDSEEDQKLKLQVRDQVLAYVSPYLEDCPSKEESARILKELLPEIEETAREVLRKEGAGEEVSVALSEEFYPTRTYGELSFPAGDYTSLRIFLGSGEGQNWWCVVFPALCLPAAEEDFTEACRAAGLTDQEISVLTEDTGEVELEFRTLEWLGKLKKMLWDA